MDNKAQSYSNHAKYDPPFHFFVLPVLALNVLAQIYYLYRNPSVWSAWGLVVSGALVALPNGLALCGRSSMAASVMARGWSDRA